MRHVGGRFPARHSRFQICPYLRKRGKVRFVPFSFSFESFFSEIRIKTYTALRRSRTT